MPIQRFKEKNITFPTDSKQHARIIKKCVEMTGKEGITLRRSYKRTVPKLLKAHAADLELYAKVVGQKAGIIKIKTKTGGMITGAMSLAGNPYDGHTLAPALEQHIRLTGHVPKVCLADKGYRGNSKIGTTRVLMPKKGARTQTPYQKQNAQTCGYRTGHRPPQK